MSAMRIRAVDDVRAAWPHDFRQAVRIALVILGLECAWLALGRSVALPQLPPYAGAGACLGAGAAWLVWSRLRSASWRQDEASCMTLPAAPERLVLIGASDDIRRIVGITRRSDGAKVQCFRSGPRETQERILLFLLPLIALVVRPAMGMSASEVGLLVLATYAPVCCEVLLQRQRCIVSSGQVTLQTLSAFRVVRQFPIDLAKAEVLLDFAEGIAVFRQGEQHVVLKLRDFWCPHRLGAAISQASRVARTADHRDGGEQSGEPGTGADASDSGPTLGVRT